ncbi:MAG: DUF4271 domain-containing protein [Chitinophagaceae bacterium]|nr:DUF4271 domain-containing protein [Chitinophagaceae bacterium]
MKFFGWIFFILIQLNATAQQDTSVVPPSSIPKTKVQSKIETTKNIQQPTIVKIQGTINGNKVIQKKTDSSIPSLLIQSRQPQPLAVEPAQKTKPVIVSAPIASFNDSLTQTIITDSNLVVQKDSSQVRAYIDYGYQILNAYPILKDNTPEYRITSFKKTSSKDFLFYLLLGVIFILALVQALFPKYLKNIFDIFFQPSFRQRQTKEQLSQEYIASFLLNFLFVSAAGIYITLISENQIQNNQQFWQFLGLSATTLFVIYLIKYAFTRFMGWVFQKQEIAESYNFLVFLMNKIIGVVLTPILFLISYSSAELKQFSLNVSIIIITLLFIYRFVKIFNSFSRLLKISVFHFFIYFCSVEILPLLILYKAIGKYIGNGI